MMQLVNSNGTVLLEREKPGTKRANNSTLHVRRMSQCIKKTVRPVLMSKEEFFTKVIKTTDDVIVFGDFLITNADGKTTFQFRTPSEGSRSSFFPSEKLAILFRAFSLSREQKNVFLCRGEKTKIENQR